MKTTLDDVLIINLRSFEDSKGSLIPIESELDLFPLVVTGHSPFGQAIIGLEVGDEFTLDIRGEEIKFTITDIDVVSNNK